MRCQTRGLLWFWIHSKQLFSSKNIPLAKNGSLKTVKSDESSLNHTFVGPFLAEWKSLEQNKCLEWIQSHHKPLVWHLTCFLKQIYFGVFILYTVKSMGPQLWLAAGPTPRVAGSDALTKSLEHTLSYICAKFGAFRLISARYPYLPRLPWCICLSMAALIIIIECLFSNRGLPVYPAL